MDAQAVQLTKEALWLVLILSGPPIAAATVVGLTVAILQAVTQIQEQTVQFLLRFLAIAIGLVVTASTIGGALYYFAERLFLDFPKIVG